MCVFRTSVCDLTCAEMRLMADEKTTEEDFQSIDKQQGSGLKAQSCLN